MTVDPLEKEKKYKERYKITLSLANQKKPLHTSQIVSILCTLLTKFIASLINHILSSMPYFMY